MVDKASSTITINADKHAVMAVIADFEAYPEWSTAIKSVTVDEVGEDGRGSTATSSIARARPRNAPVRYPTGRWPLSATSARRPSAKNREISSGRLVNASGFPAQASRERASRIRASSIVPWRTTTHSSGNLCAARSMTRPAA